MRERRGFALLIVLWMLTVASVVGIGAALLGREAYNVARNRYEGERAYWLAEGCMAAARASIDSVLEDALSSVARTRRWRSLNTAAGVGVRIDKRCRVQLLAAGDRLDVNSASEEQLLRVMTRVAGPDMAPGLVDALLDWRDADHDARPLGAEAAWYEAAHRRTPRDSAFASIDELRRVRGFEQIDGLDSVLTVESGRLSIATAPLTVLAAAPGLTDEALTRIAELRADGKQIDDIVSLTALISSSAAESLMVRYSDLVRVTTLEPDAWILTVAAQSGQPRIGASVEARLVRKGNRTAVARLRSRS